MVLVALAGGIALAAVPSRQMALSESASVSGTLTYAWHGDPQRGCAAASLCGVRGSTTVHFDGFGQLTQKGRRDELQLDSASATARVVRVDPSSRTGGCVDTVSVDGLLVHLRRITGARYAALVAGSPVSSGRCAGPVDELSRLALPARRLRTRLPGFDLHGQTAFAAGPFSGTLISTVVIRPDTSQGSSSETSTSGSATAPPVRYRRVLVEHATLRYRVRGPDGALQATFAGVPDPYCTPLDSCGVVGTLSLGVGGVSRTLVIDATRNVRRRVPARRALTDLRAGRLFLGDSGLDATVRGRLSELASRSGGTGCRDVRSEPLDLSVNGGFFFSNSRRALPFVLGNGSVSGDLLRTHCPGPAAADIVGGSPQQSGPALALASGMLPVSALGQRQLTVSLAHPGRFSSAGYSGTRGGSLRFTLALLGVRAGTRVVREPR